MREAHLRYLLAAALVVVAGYGVYTATPQADEPPASATTTMETPTVTLSPTTEEPPERLAPGLAENGVDARNLTNAHRERLRNTSYTVASTRTIRDANGTLRLQSSATHRVATGGRLGRVTSNSTSNRARELGYVGYTDIETWYNDTTALFAITLENDSRSYQQRDARDVTTDATRWNDLYQLFGTVNTTVVDRIQANGTTRYVVVSTAQPDPELFKTPRRNVTFVAVVAEDSLVQRYTVTYDTYRNGEWIHVARSVQFLAVGSTTVEKPPWFDDAMNETVDQGW